MMLALIGEKTPSYIAAPALAVSRGNLLESYEEVFDTAPPADLEKACADLEGCA
jgi:ribose transport system substrate-binding protein